MLKSEVTVPIANTHWYAHSVFLYCWPIIHFYSLTRLLPFTLVPPKMLILFTEKHSYHKQACWMSRAPFPPLWGFLGGQSQWALQLHKGPVGGCSEAFVKGGKGMFHVQRHSPKQNYEGSSPGLPVTSPFPDREVVVYRVSGLFHSHQYDSHSFFWGLLLVFSLEPCANNSFDGFWTLATLFQVKLPEVTIPQWF